MAVVFLLDLDNTLIDNDAVREHLNEGTRRLLGATLADRFWGIYEEVRDESDYVDFLETLDRFHRAASDPPEQQRALDRLILDFPYPEARYPATLDVLAALWKAGTPVVLSDGDPVFQPLKVFRSGVAEAVRGNVLVFPHKETCLDHRREALSRGRVRGRRRQGRDPRRAEEPVGSAAHDRARAPGQVRRRPLRGSASGPRA